MEFQKDLGIFHIEGGSIKTAGKGNLGATEEVPQDIKTKTNLKKDVKTAAKAIALTGLFILRHKSKKKKK
ncbi:hypothetical protein [Ruminococcus flavefaciens]|uniref:hypothetical protein n=1 Tax=Ruminococcus flavefaciens TaxID=1265 RepID=UPI00048C5924|nr:hypothetical protein [Ruminococcus flavefaciens]